MVDNPGLVSTGLPSPVWNQFKSTDDYNGISSPSNSTIWLVASNTKMTTLPATATISPPHL